MNGALDGIQVLDLTTLLPGPLATLCLAEAGADVLKVEKPGGEDMRRYPPFVDGESVAFSILNRGKRFLELDLKSDSGRQELLDLAKQADVLVEQFRPGVMARLGLDYETLAAVNPRLILCSISGYGQEGPRAIEAGHDINYMALTGVLDLSRGPVDAPILPPTQVADIGGGSFPALINILLALIARERTGRGTHLDIAMTDAMFAFAPFAHADFIGIGSVARSGTMLLTGGSPRYGLYATADRHLVAVGALEQKFWMALCEAVGLEEALRADTNDPEATRKGLAARFAARPAEDWKPILAKADCCATLVRAYPDALEDPHFVDRGLFDRDIELDSGTRIRALPLPIDPAVRRSD
ncbi:MAG: CoA transferase [Pseudomonadota bacterium]